MAPLSVGPVASYIRVILSDWGMSRAQIVNSLVHVIYEVFFILEIMFGIRKDSTLTSSLLLTQFTRATNSQEENRASYVPFKDICTIFGHIHVPANRTLELGFRTGPRSQLDRHKFIKL
jgi:hypothetical protein